MKISSKPCVQEIPPPQQIIATKISPALDVKMVCKILKKKKKSNQEP